MRTRTVFATMRKCQGCAESAEPGTMHRVTVVYKGSPALSLEAYVCDVCDGTHILETERLA